MEAETQKMWPKAGEFLPRHIDQGQPIQSFYVDTNKVRKPVVSHGDGIYLWDTAGRRYLDGSSGPVVSNLGHSNPNINAAMQRQAEKVSFASRAWFENEPNIALAGLLSELAGPGFERAFIVSGGSEAVEAALKFARQYAVASGDRGRTKILSRNPSYHGASLGAAGVTGDPESEQLFGPIMQVMPKVPAPFTYRVPTGCDTESHSASCASMLEKAILEEGPESVLAFIMEPVGGLATGGLVAEDKYYEMVRQICDRYGVLLIFDEVMSGAGRTGTFLAAEHWPQARPDIVVLAKGIAAGFTPLGVALFSNDMVDAVVSHGGFMHGHTYSANPLSCAIGYQVVIEMLRQDLMANAAARGRELNNGLWDIAQRTSIVGDVRGLGLLQAIEIVSCKDTKKSFPAETRAIDRLIEIGAREGLLLYSRRTANGVFGEWVMISPPLIISSEQIAELLRLLERTLLAFEEELKGL
jgi:adenosylmethionine-8-amino-7-oxononanoate aminotransferase